MSRLLVFLAGPFTSNPMHGTRAASLAGDILYAAGYDVYVPHLSILDDVISPHDSDYWYERTLRMVDHCDVLLRLPGESVGADRELERGKELGIPTFEGTAEEFVVMYRVDRDTVQGFTYVGDSIQSEPEIKPVVRRRRAR